MPIQKQSLRMYHYLGKNVITYVILGQGPHVVFGDCHAVITWSHHRMLNFAGFLFQQPPP